MHLPGNERILEENDSEGMPQEKQDDQKIAIVGSKHN